MQRWSTLLCRTFRSSAGLQAREFTGDKPGAKALLYDILHKSAEPLTSTQIWEQAETAGIKSKRHVKQLLSAMRQAAVIQTRPMGKGKNFVYKLRNVTAKAVEAQIGKQPQQSPVSTA